MTDDLRPSFVPARMNITATLSCIRRGVLFLGTPHRGSNFSRWGKKMASFLQPLSSNSFILGELEYDSPHLHDLHEQFTQVAANIQCIINFYEQRMTRIFKLWWFQWEEFVRDPNPFLLLGLTTAIVCSAAISYLVGCIWSGEECRSCCGPLWPEQIWMSVERGI